MDSLNKIEDYQCTMVKRERINGELGEHEYMFVKVRHKPFSVYTYFLAPALLMPLSLFVAFIQTFVFVLLSQLYLSEVSHAPHDAHAAHGAESDESEEFIVPVLT